MNFLPDQLARRVLRTTETGDLQQIAPAVPTTPFFQFSYSSHQLRIVNGQTHVTSKQVRYDGNQVNLDEFSGTLPADAYEKTILDTQQFFAEQTMSLMKQFSAFLPFPMLHIGKNE